MRAFIVAEIASNWEGSVSVAKKLIKESKKAGADAVKFQMWRASDLYQGHPDWKIIKKSELTFAKVKTLKTYSDKLGIEFFCSGFYPESIEYLQSLGVKRYKLASRTCTLNDPNSLETITKISSYKIMDLVKAISPKTRVKFVGIRIGEKIDEQLITEAESFKTYDLGKYYTILPSNTEWSLEKFVKLLIKPCVFLCILAKKKSGKKLKQKN